MRREEIPRDYSLFAAKSQPACWKAQLKVYKYQSSLQGHHIVPKATCYTRRILLTLVHQYQGKRKDGKRKTLKIAKNEYDRKEMFIN